MLALSRFRNILLGSVAAAAVIGSIIAPAASAAVLPVSTAASPALQRSDILHPFSIRLLSVYVHDDGDGFALGAGEWRDDYTHIDITGASGGSHTFRLDNGNGWSQIYAPFEGVRHVQQYCSDKNYPMTQLIEGYNKYFGLAKAGTTLTLRSRIEEDDGILSFGTFAERVKHVTVPPVGQEKIVSYDVESEFGAGSHVRATYTVRIATSY